MRVAVFGFGDVGSRALEILDTRGHEVVALWTHRPNANEPLWLPATRPTTPAYLTEPYKKLGEPHISTLRALKPDLILSAWFRSILPPEMLAVAPAYNVHASRLPTYRGRCPLNWVLVNGETGTGVTIHRMEPRVDRGAIAYQYDLPIGPDTTIVDLTEDAEDSAALLLHRLLHDLENGREPPSVPQYEPSASYFHGRKPADGEFHWSWPARRIHNLVRAVTYPWPGAFTLDNGKPLYVWKSSIVPANTLRPGAGFILEPDRFCVGTGSRALQVHTWGDTPESGARPRPGIELADNWSTHG